MLAFCPDRSLFGPSRGDIDAIDGVNELSGRRVAAVSDGVGFKESGSGFIPLARFHRDSFFEDGAGFGCSQSSFLILRACFGHQSINRSGRDFEEFLFHFFGNNEFIIEWQPEWDDVFKSFGTGQIGRNPEVAEYFE